MKILAVGAHLDDIEIACGGTLFKAIKNGHQVKALILSKSGYKNLQGIVQRTNETAIKEGINALHTLNINDIQIEDFPNMDIIFSSGVVTTIDRCIMDYDPDIIFTHHPFDTHQSHEGVAKATIAAARRKNTIFFYEPITPSGRSYVAFKPTLYVDIELSIQKKLEALRCHTTEYNKFGAEDWIEGVRCRCGYRGYEIGKKFAEAFEILRLECSFDKGVKL